MKDIEQKLPEWVKPGAEFKTTYGHADIDLKYHVRAIVDGQAVLRWWCNRKKRWVYRVEWWGWFYANRKNIEIVKHAKEPANA